MTILAVIQLLSAVGYLLALLFLLGVSGIRFDQIRLNSIAVLEEDLAASFVTVGLMAAMCLVALSSAILLFRMNRLGWTLTMLVTGLSLSSQIYAYYLQGAGTLVPFVMIINVVTVLYLNQREVRVAFGIGKPEELSSPELEERA